MSGTGLVTVVVVAGSEATAPGGTVVPGTLPAVDAHDSTTPEDVDALPSLRYQLAPPWRAT